MRNLVLYVSVISIVLLFSCHKQGLVVTNAPNLQLNESLPPDAKPGACYKRAYPPIICYPSHSKTDSLKNESVPMKVSNPTPSEWRQVLCEKEMTKGICEQINNQLWSRGYLENQSPCIIRGNSAHLSKEAREAFKAFQLENNLQHAYMDLETLDLLGVFY